MNFPPCRKRSKETRRYVKTYLTVGSGSQGGGSKSRYEIYYTLPDWVKITGCQWFSRSLSSGGSENPMSPQPSSPAFPSTEKKCRLSKRWNGSTDRLDYRADYSAPRSTRTMAMEDLLICSRRWPNGRCLHPTRKSWPRRDVTYVEMHQKLKLKQKFLQNII